LQNWERNNLSRDITNRDPTAANPAIAPALATQLAPILQLHILDTGYCTVAENYLVTGGRHIRVPVHALVALINHPTRGWFLFDTGYAPRVLDATRGYPFRAYRWATPMTISAELAVVNQLGRFGISSEDISTIVLSHFHADHVAGLHDFPAASFVAGREAWTAVRELASIRALSHAFIPSLIPADFEKRSLLIDDFAGPEISPFGKSHDLFSDGSVLLLRLPGHATGQLGLLIHTQQGQVFLVADSYYMPASLRERTPPHPITRFFAVDDWQALKQTIHKLADFALANPEVRIIPTHCPDTFRTYVEQSS
jgi:glyoxylase-like metal-dependent hydrolase (beta-lactamase superfamily II)